MKSVSILALAATASATVRLGNPAYSGLKHWIY